MSAEDEAAVDAPPPADYEPPDVRVAAASVTGPSTPGLPLPEPTKET